MKRLFCITALFLSALLKLSPQSAGISGNFHLTAEPFFSVRDGTQYEYVYIDYNNQKLLLSQLDWEQKPLITAGGKLSLGYKSFFVGGGAYIALPYRHNGTVYDYDWLNREYDYSPEDVLNRLTNYSESDCVLDSHYNLNAQIGWKINLGGGKSISPFAAVDYEKSSYKAMGLEASYGTTDSSGYKGSWDDEDNSYTFSYNSSLMALQLERISYTTWLGAQIYLPLNRHWSVEFSTAISPFCWMQSLDSHPFGEYKYFLDVMTAYLCGINNSFAAAFNIDSHNAIVLGANILSIYGLDGVTYTSEKKDGVFTRISGASGASLLYMNTTLSYRFSL